MTSISHRTPILVYNMLAVAQRRTMHPWQLIVIRNSSTSCSPHTYSVKQFSESTFVPSIFVIFCCYTLSMYVDPLPQVRSLRWPCKIWT